MAKAWLLTKCCPRVANEHIGEAANVGALAWKEL